MESNTFTTIKEESGASSKELKEICQAMEVQLGDWDKESSGIERLTDLIGIGKTEISISGD